MFQVKKEEPPSPEEPVSVYILPYITRLLE